MIFLTWLERLKKLPRTPALVERMLVRRARHIVSYRRREKGTLQHTLWVDISVINRHDAGSGIQRVVRALLAELQTLSISGWRVQPVAATPSLPYRAVSWTIPGGEALERKEIEPQAGDIFLGLDLSAHIVHHHQNKMLEWKKRGLKIAFVVYDLLPMQHPEWFSAKLVRVFRQWIRSVAALADSVFCISEPVKLDFNRFMRARYALNPSEVPAHVFPMGGDIRASRPSTSLPQGFPGRLAIIERCKAALMVGTIEPRKGHSQILDAFEQLWADGKQHALVIVGKPGWMTESLQSRIVSNSYFDQRLFWFDNASDEALELLYEKCTGVIAASFAEGYGLPLIEALEHGKPVLARDIRVFHQFEVPMVSYFSSDAGVSTIADAVDRWLESVSALDVHVPKIKLPTWHDSLNGLLIQLLPPQTQMVEHGGEFA